jgi:trehalose synthase
MDHRLNPLPSNGIAVTDPNSRRLGSDLAFTPRHMEEVRIPPASFARFIATATAARRRHLHSALRGTRRLLRGRRVWHVNSTRTGGGVAEMLQTLLGYERDAGLDARWLVIEGEPDFFAITKRLHHLLHGRNGPSHRLPAEARDVYGAVTRGNLDRIRAVVRPGDIVMLHDPQTAGLAPALRDHGARVVWRCHIGCDGANGATRQGWEFLQPYLAAAHAYVFSRRAYVPAWIPSERVFIIPPAIDPLSLKNAPLGRASVLAVMRHIGLLGDRSPNGGVPFTRLDGSPALVSRRALIVQTAPVPHKGVPTVVQVSRWDPLKDMAGVMRGFAERAERLPGVHLLLVGPDVSGVTDDPEGAQVYNECVARWERLPAAIRERVHLVSLPMADVDENAVMVNAIQRHATVLVQKSLKEGFGLTVTEAMWKGRPVIAGAVGGIQDQIQDGIHGLLLEDPTDTRAFGLALERLFRSPGLVRRLRRNARRRARNEFLGHRQLSQFLQLLDVVA